METKDWIQTRQAQNVYHPLIYPPDSLSIVPAETKFRPEERQYLDENSDIVLFFSFHFGFVIRLFFGGNRQTAVALVSDMDLHLLSL